MMDLILEPGKTPHENIHFLLVLMAVLKAIDTHADLLRESASNVGNDHRLGANDSAGNYFCVSGEQLDDVLEQLISTGQANSSIQKEKLKTGVNIYRTLIKMLQTKQNSPLAFTGNKFEFRMVGSSDSISEANVVLNTIVAEAFSEIADG
jgi:glutamine synthetase